MKILSKKNPGILYKIILYIRTVMSETVNQGNFLDNTSMHINPLLCSEALECSKSLSPTLLNWHETSTRNPWHLWYTILPFATIFYNLSIDSANPLPSFATLLWYPDYLYPFPKTEMEYCASAASMLAEEIWQIAEEFVEVPTNL